jgi:hypothetical protein
MKIIFFMSRILVTGDGNRLVWPLLLHTATNQRKQARDNSNTTAATFLKKKKERKDD